MPKPQVKDLVLDIKLSADEWKLVQWAADLELLRLRPYARRAVLMAAKERIRIESGLDGAKSKS